MPADNKLTQIDEAFERLNTLLDSSGALESAQTQRATYEVRLAIVRALGDDLRIEAAAASIAELEDEDVQSVVDDVVERGREYGFAQDEDGVREAVEESANLLKIELSEECIAKACDRVLEAQSPAVGFRP